MTKQSKERAYVAIDLKSFYASVACADRGLDPLRTNLVVADESRTEKTICLAVSPSLKSYGISGRARLFEVIERVNEVNSERLKRAPGHRFTGESYDNEALKRDPSLKLSFVIAVPQMARYMQRSSEIYEIYLKYIAPEDIHVYSIDEVMMDVTDYLNTYKMTARELTVKMVREVLFTTGITATAGIGTNLYLCKVAMDIVAKHMPADEDGVRIAEINERSYRELLWTHKPLTDFWRVGHGIENRLKKLGLYTMGDIARCSIGGPGDYHNEELLYKTFGINAELLIDHAWGYEPCTMADIKAYKPENNSLSQGQVLKRPYSYQEGEIIVREMAEVLAMDLVDKKLVGDQIVLYVGYDIENLQDPERRKKYKGPVSVDYYGRAVPKHVNGSANLGRMTSAGSRMIEAALSVYKREVDPNLLVRRISISVNHVISEEEAEKRKHASFRQLNLFTDILNEKSEEEAEDAALEKEHKLQLAMLDIQKRFGKNAVLKGTSLEKGAMTVERNTQIGGHKA